VHLDGGVAIGQGLDEDVIDDVTISTAPVVIDTGCWLLGGRPQTVDLDTGLGSQLSQRARTAHYDRKR
jgi:hypothetical protein